MQFYNSYHEVCQQTQKPVQITASVEAMGGYGCAVGQDAVLYECSLQDECPMYQKGDCHLNK